MSEPITSAPEPPAWTPKPGAGLQDAAGFLGKLQAPAGLFAGPLTAPQVRGCLQLCDAGAGVLPLSWMAYVLATTHHETGKTYDPGQVEGLNYSADALVKKFSRDRISRDDANRIGRTLDHPADQPAIANLIYGGPWGLAHLGNSQPGDGWKYRGRSWPQLTGRALYAKADAKLGLGGALLADPSLIGRLDVASRVMVGGMKGGWFTGAKLGDFLASRASLDQFTHARAIINGTDMAAQIAGYALQFQDALSAGGWL